MFYVDTTNINNITDIFEETGIGLVEQILMISYTFVVLVFGIIGNSLVLIGTVKYKAIDMDIVTIKLIENLAICDIICTVMLFTSMFTVVTSRRWILGNALCFITAYFTLTPYIAEILTTTLIVIQRLCSVKFPLSGRYQLEESNVMYVIALMWCVAFAQPICMILIEDYAYFAPEILACSTLLHRTQARYYEIAASVLLMLIPILVIVICNSWLLIISAKSRKTVSHGQKSLPSW